MFALLMLVMLQPSQPVAAAGEITLVWTNSPDPDPGYVPPPPTAEELEAERARKAWDAELRRRATEFQRAEAKVAEELRRAEQTIANTCAVVREAIGEHPACSQRR